MELVVHHWDVDGICSAALLLEKFEGKNVSPTPGFFEFDRRIWKAIGEAEKVYVVDLNLVREVEKIEKPVVFLDHHLQERVTRENVRHINPVLEGSEAPSASYVVSTFLSNWNWKSALGAVGDLGRKAFHFDWVSKILKRYGLSEEDALRLAELMNSPSVLCDRDGVERAVNKVIENEPRDLIEDEEWNKNLEIIKREVDRIVESARKIGTMAVAKFSTNHNVSSIIARKLVWDLKNEIAVVVNENFHGFAQLYVRAQKEKAHIYRIEELIEKLRKLGLNAGGKREVLGVICEKGRLKEAVGVVEEHLGEPLW